jgi:hypothetical protein
MGMMKKTLEKYLLQLWEITGERNYPFDVDGTERTRIEWW